MYTCIVQVCKSTIPCYSLNPSTSHWLSFISASFTEFLGSRGSLVHSQRESEKRKFRLWPRFCSSIFWKMSQAVQRMVSPLICPMHSSHIQSTSNSTLQAIDSWFNLQTLCSTHVKSCQALWGPIGSVCRDKPPRCWYVAQSKFELGLFRYSRTHGPSANLQRNHCWCPPQLPWLLCKVNVVCQSGTPFKILKYCAFPSLRSS